MRPTFRLLTSSHNTYIRLHEVYLSFVPFKSTFSNHPEPLSKRSFSPLWSNRFHHQSSIYEEMPRAGYYAVHTGRRPGIYQSWAECEEQIKGFSGAKYKKFPSVSQARIYLSSTTLSTPATANIVESPSIGHATRAESPPSCCPPSTLPDHLREIADKGYSFTKSPHHLIVYTDGSGLGNGKVGARAGLGVFWGDRGEPAAKNFAERVPGVKQTNNRGELLSVIRALEACPDPDVPLEIRTDSQYTIMCMTTYLPRWLRNNFTTSSTTFPKPTPAKQVTNTDLIKHMLVLLRRRGPKNGVRFRYVPGHSGEIGNESADRLAKLGAGMPELPEREWLDPNDEDYQDERVGKTDVEVEVDASWLMTPIELAEFEKDSEEV